VSATKWDVSRAKTTDTQGKAVTEVIMADTADITVVMKMKVCVPEAIPAADGTEIPKDIPKHHAEDGAKTAILHAAAEEDVVQMMRMDIRAEDVRHPARAAEVGSVIPKRHAEDGAKTAVLHAVEEAAILTKKMDIQAEVVHFQAKVAAGTVIPKDIPKLRAEDGAKTEGHLVHHLADVADMLKKKKDAVMAAGSAILKDIPKLHAEDGAKMAGHLVHLHLAADADMPKKKVADMADGSAIAEDMPKQREKAGQIVNSICLIKLKKPECYIPAFLN
jgi:hypothetical protein